jgi:glycosyltransferase 2 family protein
VAALVLPAAFLAWARAGIDATAVYHLLARTGPAGLVVLCPYFAAMVFDTLAWRRLLGGLPSAPRFGALLACRLSAEAFGAVLPSGALASEAVAATLLKRHGVAWAPAVASLAARRCVAMLTHGLTLGLAALLCLLPGTDRGLALHLFGHRSASLTSVVGGAAAVLFLATLLLSGAVRGAAHRLPFVASVAGHATWGAVASASPFFLLVWLSEACETFLILRLLDTGLGFPQVLACESIASLLRAAAFFVPSGAGVQDAAYVALLQALGVERAVSVGMAFVVVKRAKEILWIAAGYLLLAKAGEAGHEHAKEASPLHLRVDQPDDADASDRPRAAGV